MAGPYVAYGEQVQPLQPAAANAGGEPVRPLRAYEFADGQGRRARAWWQPAQWVVVADDAGFRRRIVRALKRPIWLWETTVSDDGVPSCTPIQVPPTDPRYLRGLPTAWGQVGLDDVDIAVVTLGDPTAQGNAG